MTAVGTTTLFPFPTVLSAYASVNVVKLSEPWSAPLVIVGIAAAVSPPSYTFVFVVAVTVIGSGVMLAFRAGSVRL